MSEDDKGMKSMKPFVKDSKGSCVYDFDDFGFVGTDRVWFVGSLESLFHAFECKTVCLDEEYIPVYLSDLPLIDENIVIVNRMEEIVMINKRYIKLIRSIVRAVYGKYGVINVLIPLSDCIFVFVGYGVDETDKSSLAFAVAPAYSDVDMPFAIDVVKFAKGLTLRKLLSDYGVK